MKKLSVVAAVIIHEGKYLCALKGEHKYSYLSHKYEFPGGKVEPNETAEQALIREIYEELNLTIDVKSYLLTVEHSYSDFQIELATYLCEATSIDELVIHEHQDIKWSHIEELEQLDWAAADLPIVQYLLNNKI
ncbi:DNA mismatch repair protein MutT [Acinetobacter sp. NRRL B-65365]|uniref:(deoxy)nucleoside triphosphate pyrophosphohydrolase n=1 Tax=Acinetobacter sp. NRRL B-65365 TaxID=1785092 RepID=UPI0007A02CAF|nr:(deoxy)nucleoside triphosphate pyrophosphohydrolase [Acinetobacter sp. NRRL B-65365]KYQ84282.1 DNA mismatch repair protein MutT [Acinetobacter sp. NRRL B-65365]